MKPVRSMIVFLLMVSASAQAVVIDGRDWRQVIETTNITYNQMAGVCDVVTGACNGIVAGVDVTGWTWADDVAIASLFEVVSGAPGGTFDVDKINYTERDATWADDFMDTDGAGPDGGLFTATWQYVLRDHDYSVFGVTRNIVNGNADRSFLRYHDDPVAGVLSAAVVGNEVGLDIARVHTGHWLYKDVQVPAPATLWLGLILFTAMLVRRR